MKVRSIEPLSSAREFKFNEMFFSTTDGKGNIVSGNGVFARVSGFSTEELHGKPHNLIRHPDMPRSAFALLWGNLKQGRPFVGYVKNMAKDGGYYWVLAVVVPASGGRYLSVRFKPSSPLFAQVEALYKQMLVAENMALAGGARQPDAVAAGLRVAIAALQQLGFENYDAFSHAALNLEMKARDTQLQAGGTRLFPATLPGAEDQEFLAALYGIGVQTYDHINGLFRKLDDFARFSRDLQEKASLVLGVSEDFRLHALNVNTTSQRMGSIGDCVATVATFLDSYAMQLAEDTGRLRGHLSEVSRATETINARIAMARLQMEMLLFFHAESAGKQEPVNIRQLGDLQECFIASTTQAREALALLQDKLPRLHQSREVITRIVISIEIAQVRGLTEAARIPNAESLRSMLAEFRGKIGTTRTQLNELSAVMDGISALTASAPRQIGAIQASATNMQTGLATLDAARIEDPAPPAGDGGKDPASPPSGEASPVLRETEVPGEVHPAHA